MGKRIVVTGGRDYSNAAKVASALSAIHRKHGISHLIQGGANGADRLCAEWAWENASVRSTHVQISGRYMQRYLDEFCFRANNRNRVNGMFDLLVGAL